VIFQALEPLLPPALFHQKLPYSDGFDDPWHQNDQYWSIFVEWIIKNPNFY
jgi:hypothetical protein